MGEMKGLDSCLSARYYGTLPFSFILVCWCVNLSSCVLGGFFGRVVRSSSVGEAFRARI